MVQGAPLGPIQPIQAFPVAGTQADAGPAPGSLDPVAIQPGDTEPRARTPQLDPLTGAPVGERATAEAIAVLQVGRDVFFASAAERRTLLLSLAEGADDDGLPPPPPPAAAAEQRGGDSLGELAISLSEELALVE